MSPDQQRMARELAEEFKARAAVYDAENRFPHENFDTLRKAGYLALTVPTEFGGGGCGLADLCRLQLVLAGGCSATALAANMHLHMLGVAAGQWRRTREPLLETFFKAIVETGTIIAACASEGGGVNSYTDARARAIRAAGGYVVSGRKHFCSLSPVLEWIVTSATTDDDGTRRLLQLLIARDAPGLTIHQTWDAMGMRATGSHELGLEDVFVPDEMVLNNREVGVYDDYAQEALKWFTLTVAATYTGIASAASDFVRARLGKKSAHDWALRLRDLGEIEASLRAAHALIERTACECDRHEWGSQPHLVKDAVATKYFATNVAVRVVHMCLDLAGGPGYLKTSPLERWYRDVRAGIIHPPNNRDALTIVGEIAAGVWPVATEPGGEPDDDRSASARSATRAEPLAADAQAAE